MSLVAWIYFMPYYMVCASDHRLLDDIETRQLSGLFAPYIPPDITVDESLKDESLVALAHSNALYDNVGMLCREINVFGCSLFFDYCSVVYIGERICLTAMHGVNNEYLFSHYVEFSVSGFKKKYGIQSIIKHPLYSNVHESYVGSWFKPNKLSYENDIAIIVLDCDVDGLLGLEPNYKAFPLNRVFKDFSYPVTYVGYGARICDHGWFIQKDQHRRAERSYVYGVNSQILTAPYGLFPDGKTVRPHLLYEADLTDGLSGGAVLHHQDGLIGLLSHVFIGTKQTCWSRFMMKCRQECFSMLMFPLDIIRIFSIFRWLPEVNVTFINHGSSGGSVPLFLMKDFIEETRMRVRRDNCVQFSDIRFDDDIEMNGVDVCLFYGQTLHKRD